MRIHHMGLTVTDLDRSIAFYCEHFGFRVAGRAEFEGAGLAFLDPGDGPWLELAAEGRPPGPPADHIALRVEDLDLELSRLAAAGVPLLDPAPAALWNGGRTAFCQGPDGELIELIEWPEP